MAVVVGMDERVKKRVTCRECAAIVEYVPGELKTWATSCCGERGTATGLDCPGCHQPIVVSST